MSLFIMLGFVIVFILCLLIFGVASWVPFLTEVERRIVQGNMTAYVVASICMFLLLLMSFSPSSDMLPGSPMMLTIIYVIIAGWMSFSEFMYARKHRTSFRLSAG